MAIEQTPPEPALRDPRRRRRQLTSLIWLCGWGGATAVALIALAITSQTETAGGRLRRIFPGSESAAIAQMPPRLAQLEVETQVLAAQIRALGTDRDRMTGRIALLESSIDDMTGAIKKQAAATAAVLAARANPPVPAPVTASVTATSASSAGDPTTGSIPPASATPTPRAETLATQATPMPPARIATRPTADTDTPLLKQPDFALDLGGGATIEAVRQRWTTVKAHFGPLLSGMHPLAARDTRPGATGYRLVVGPLPNSTAATGLCARFVAARTACRAVKFDGEQIAQQ